MTKREQDVLGVVLITLSLAVLATPFVIAHVWPGFIRCSVYGIC